MSNLPLFLDLAEAVIVHGYLESGISLLEKKPSMVCGTMGGDRILRDHYDRPWYESYDGDRPVIVSHMNYTDSDQPFIYQDKVFGLDTSCVMGKALTGLLLPSFRILSVPSRGNLWERVRKTYSIARKPDTVKAIETWSEQDHAALAELIEKVEAASEIILAKLRFTPRYSKLNPRRQA